MMSLSQLSLLFVYASLVAIGAAMIFFAFVFSSRRTDSLVKQAIPAGGIGEPDDLAGMGDQSDSPQANGHRVVNVGIALCWVATALLGVALVTRALSVGRAPWGNMYEFAISGCFASLVAFLIVSLRRNVSWIAVWVVVPVFALLGLAVTVLYTEAAPLVPALDSAWLIIHVAAAIIAFGAFTVAAGAALGYLVTQRARKSDKPPGWLAGAPTAEALDRLTYRLIAFAFPIWTFAVIAGAIWAENAWGRYWGWDPKETWALITWVVYAAYLHARVTAGWPISRSMIIGLVGYLTLLFNFFGVNILIPGLHSYAGI